MLTDAGLDPSALQCPPDWPADADELARYAAEAGPEARRTPLAYNCSGKHAGFLAACTALFAAAAAFLCSAQASYITGVALLVDGGLVRAV